jgi:serine/threonine-protein kinase
VWRARDTRLKREVALKVLPAAFAADADRVARFQREAELLATLAHPHIAAIYGLEEADGVRALVLELVEGETLAERLARGPVAVEEAVVLARQLAEALDYAHEHGVLHRDLKPANLKVTPDGQLKVLDFGLAKGLASLAQAPGSGRRAAGAPGSVERDELPTITSPAFTQAGMLIGTAAYMAPEQARGKSVDKRADIWAFGCVLYELLTGRRAFEGETISDTLAAVLTREPDWARLPAATPAALRMLLARCLARDPKDRLRDIGEVRYWLDTSATMRPGQAGPAAGIPPASPRSRVVMALPWAVAGLALIVAAASLWTETPGQAERAAQLPERQTFTIPGAPGSVITAAGSRPVLSPDGRRIALTARDRSGMGIWLYEVASGEWRRLRTEGLAAGGLFWSADGRAIAFASQAYESISAVDIESGTVRTTASPPAAVGFGFDGTWLSDGSMV